MKHFKVRMLTLLFMAFTTFWLCRSFFAEELLVKVLLIGGTTVIIIRLCWIWLASTWQERKNEGMTFQARLDDQRRYHQNFETPAFSRKGKELHVPMRAPRDDRRSRH